MRYIEKNSYRSEYGWKADGKSDHSWCKCGL